MCLSFPNLLDSSETLLKPIKHVATVAVIDPSTNSILMGRRTDNGKWTNPGGHTNHNEPPYIGAMRELREEAGIVTTSLKYLGSETVTCRDGQKRTIHAYVTYGKPKTTGKYDPDGEVKQWFWVPMNLPKSVANNLHSPKNVLLKLLGIQKYV